MLELGDRRKIPSPIRISERTRACRNCSPQESPRDSRLANENGIATPTMNMKQGWIRSQATQPVHSTCWSCQAAVFQNIFQGLPYQCPSYRVRMSAWCLTRLEMAHPSETISSIVKPRNASNDISRSGIDFEAAAFLADFSSVDAAGRAGGGGAFGPSSRCLNAMSRTPCSRRSLRLGLGIGIRPQRRRRVRPLGD